MKYYTQALRTGNMHSRDHGHILHIQLTPEQKVVFDGTTKQFEDNRRLDERIKNMTPAQKAALLAKLMES